MTIHVHIERLVLDGLPIDKSQGAAIGAAVEAELGRLIAEGHQVAGVPMQNVERLHGRTIRHSGVRDAGGLGNQIAGSVYGAMTS